MSEYSWSEYTKIKNDYALSSVKLLFNSLKSLVNSPSLQIESKTLKCVLKRIAIRLRSAKVTQIVKHAKKCLDTFLELNLSDVMTENMLSLVSENYEISSGRIVLPFKQQIESVLKVFITSASVLRKFILVSMNAFSHCNQWLRLGNLAPHFLMMSSCLSRLNLISKAILVYINDLYLPLIAVKDVLEEKQTIYKETNSFPDSLQDFLIDLNIKSDNKSIKTENQSKDTIIGENEDIGVRIERNESKDKTNEDKPKPNKKKKNKKKLNIKTKHEMNKKTKPQKQIKSKKRRKN